MDDKQQAGQKQLAACESLSAQSRSFMRDRLDDIERIARDGPESEDDFTLMKAVLLWACAEVITSEYR
jgi:hypothetical protein